MTTLASVVDNKIVRGIKTYVSGHKSTISCLELGRNFPYDHVVPNEELRISSEASDTSPC